MKPTKEDLMNKYSEDRHFHIPCFIDNPKLDKMMTGEGSNEAKHFYPDYVETDAIFDKEDKYKVWEIASKINANPDVSFFTCTADRTLQNLHLEVWGSDELLNAARLTGENGDILLRILTGDEK